MRRSRFSATILISTLVLIPTTAQANVKAGGSCSKVGSITTVLGVKYLCAKSGKVSIWVKTAASAKPAPAPSVAPAKLGQAISVPQYKSVNITEGKFSGTFTSNSKLPVELATSTPLVCSVQKNAIFLLQTGTCLISANQSGNDRYVPAKSIAFALEVKAPTITSDNALLDQVQTFIRVPMNTAYASDTAEITLTAFSNDATAKVCAGDPSALGCTLTNGSGVADPTSQTKYVEFVFHVKNLDSNPLPSISYRLLQNGVLSDIDTGVTLETLNGLSLGTDESADGSLFGMVPINQNLDGSYLLIDEGITDPSVKLLLSLSN